MHSPEALEDEITSRFGGVFHWIADLKQIQHRFRLMLPNSKVIVDKIHLGRKRLRAFKLFLKFKIETKKSKTLLRGMS